MHALIKVSAANDSFHASSDLQADIHMLQVKTLGLF